MNYSKQFYSFVAFVFGLMLLGVPLTAQYSEFALPAIAFGLLYVYIMLINYLGHITISIIIRIIVHLMYGVTAIRSAYVAAGHITTIRNSISWIDFFLAAIAALVFCTRCTVLFIENYDYIMHRFF